jgi:hypothetical protein
LVDALAGRPEWSCDLQLQRRTAQPVRWLHVERGSLQSILDLQAINRSVDQHSDDPKPFIWAKPADQIVASANRLQIRHCIGYA